MPQATPHNAPQRRGLHAEASGLAALCAITFALATVMLWAGILTQGATP